MKWEFYIIEGTIFILGLILYLILKYSTPSYFSQKGKNLATKQDVEEITKKVESVKSEFNKDLEFIKSDLSYINQNKFTIKSIERDILFELIENYGKWINTIKNVSFIQLTVHNFKDLLNNYFEEMRIKRMSCENSEFKFNLFIDDNNFFQIQKNCKVEVLKLELITKQIINEIFYEYEKEFNENEKYEKEIISYEQLFEFKKQNFLNIKEIIEKFHSQSIEQLKELVPKEDIYVNYLKEKLFEVLQNNH